MALLLAITNKFDLEKIEMKIETVVNEITDGAITSVTLRIHSRGKILQEIMIDLQPYENRAMIKSNKLYIDDKRLISDCFAILKKELGNHGVDEILISDTEGNRLVYSLPE
ncbi:MAG: hypothetical protein LUG52_02780 [Clostridia bacterium]|nr:hypothetical protein [Clostridia bacterium]